MHPTVAQVLALDVVQRGRPEVLTAHDALDRPVRWVHVAEISDIATLLRGGELILTTGIALPAHAAGLRGYIDGLADVGVCCLVVELGRKFRELPDPLVRAAKVRGLPLVVLHRGIPFITVTETVHGMIVNAQLAELRASDQVHRVFTELSVEGAEPQAVVRAVADIAAAPVVLENLAHQVLVFEPGSGSATDLLEDWETRSRQVRTAARTAYDDTAGWALTMVGARGEDWGRLVAVTAAAPTTHQLMVLERGATTLALGRLAERDRESLERQTHRSLLGRILEHRYASTQDVHLRAKALGIPLDGRLLLGVVVRLRGAARSDSIEGQARLRQDSELVSDAVRASRVKALVGALPSGDIGVLISLPLSDRYAASLQRLATSVHTAVRTAAVAPDRAPLVAVGSAVTAVGDVRRSFHEAEQVAAAAPTPQQGRAYVELPDVRVRGLLHLLRDDVRVQTFVERELGPLLAHPELVEALTTFLSCGRNVSAAAQAAFLSRPSFYDRLRRIEGVLGVALDDVEVCLSLHVALVGLQAMRGSDGSDGPTGSPGR